MHRYRSHTCGALRHSDIGQTVRLSGWCHRIRDHGGVLFIDLRDHYGLTQCVVDPDSPAFKDAERLRSEWVVRVDGKVRRRPEGTANPELPTGEVELYVSEIEVLGPSGELPLPVFGEQDYPEDIRLKYRFLDLRREKLHQNIMTRGAIVDAMRKRMKDQGFFEFQTPILTASSPEGARDFLVPSRIHPGKFYALPQAPQQYKQLLMMSGFDRYFQIAPCFRDEDPRADRLPGEFYQLDVEMSFVTQDDVFAAMEPVITGVFEDFAKGKPVTKNWPRIPFAEALRKYGTDKPDLRNPIVMQDASEHFRGSGFKVFARMLEDPKNQVWAIPGKGGGSRAFCDRMNSWAQGEGQPGLGYIMWRGSEGVLDTSNPDQKRDRDETQRLLDQGKVGDAIDTGRRAAMRRGAVLERAVHAAETLDDVLLAIARDLERLHHRLGAMVADAAGGDLVAVAGDVVLERLDGQRVLRLQRVEAALRHGERVVREVDLLVFLVVLVHREVDDPGELEPILVDQVQFLAEPGACQPRELPEFFGIAGNEERGVTRF